MKPVYWIARAAIVVAVASSAVADANVPAFPTLHSRFQKRIFVSSNGDTLLYRLWLPRHFDSAKRYPLILFLHGAGERGSDNEAQLKNDEFMNLVADSTHPAILLAPQCPRDQWWSPIEFDPAKPQILPEKPTRPMRLTLELLQQIEQEFKIDPARRYVTGLSMGGYGTYDILVRKPGYFAAAVVVCGGGDTTRVGEMSDVAFWIFHGESDPVVPVQRARAMVRALKRAGARVRYTEYPGVGHNSWTRAYLEPELRPWLFRQSRPVASGRQ